MAFVNSPDNFNSLFSSTQSKLNFKEKSSSEINDIVKSLNIVNSDDLSQKDASLILKRIDSYEGLFTTQQLENIDYKDFKNHVFFDSAVNKVTSSFERIQQIPYDKDELENIKFFNNSDGYTNFLLKKKYPTFKGYLKFNGNQALTVFDEQGKILDDTKERGVGLLNPTRFRFSFDFWLKPDSSGFTENQIVFQKIQIENNIIKNGYICYTSDSLNSKCNLNFKSFVNGETYNTKTQIDLDQWQNIVINVNIDKKVSFIIKGENILESSIIRDSVNTIKKKAFPLEFKSKNIPFSIGGVFYVKNGSISKTLTDNDNVTYSNLKGSVDEFRMFLKFRSKNTIRKEMHKNVYAQKSLILYLRLNEPAGSYTNSCLTIDYSGNKLHGLIYDLSNSTIALLNNTTEYKINSESDGSWHLNLEKKEDSPVLNSAYTNIINLREELIKLAKNYDSNNPNLIFNMLPRHYFLNASDFQNLPVFSNDDVYSTGNQIQTDNLNITTKSQINANIPANNELVNIILIWAKFFDKLKMYISSITNLLNVDYDAFNEEKIVAMQIPILCKMYGFDFKEIFPTITKSKLNNLNLKFEDVVSEHSIRKIQNLLWQRFLINTQDFLKSKGTVRSIETTFNSFGINYKKFIDIKEYSYSNTISQNKNFLFETIDTFAADFGNIISLTNGANFANVAEGPSTNKIFLEVSNIRSKQIDQTDNNDTLENGLSKNDWSIELFFDFKESINKKRFINQSKLNQVLSPDSYYNNVQSLFSIDSGTLGNDDFGVILYAKYERINSYNNDLGTLTIEIQPIAGGSFNQTLVLNNVNIFDIEKHLVITQKRDVNKLTYSATISDVGNQIAIKKPIKATSSITITGDSLDSRISSNNYLFSADNKINNLRIGDYKYSTLNNLNSISAQSNAIFEGKIIKIRFWKHCLLEEEIFSHSKNIKNFSKKNNKPLETLIFDAEIKNIDRSLNVDSDGFYVWNVEDITNNSVLNASNIESLNTCKIKTKNVNQTDDLVVLNHSVTCKVFNPKIDEVTSSNKVNILSYKEEENKESTSNFTSFPSNETHSYYDYDSVNRVGVDMSIVKAINEDISKIITNMDDFTSNISNSMSMYEYQYKNLQMTRDNYFNKFKDDSYVNYASIGNVFKYFDNIMSSILYDIVPSRVRFEGFNFVYESHTLERHKYEHKNKDSINTIVSYENRFDFSRDSILSRRGQTYNLNRTRT